MTCPSCKQPIYSFITLSEYRQTKCGCVRPYERTNAGAGQIVVRDIDGYVSPLDGKWVGSRSAHRDHMKRHNVFEMGNEKPGLGPREVTIPKDAIRSTIRETAERMKSDGTWREV
jgi:hypothetical protein